MTRATPSSSSTASRSTLDRSVRWTNHRLPRLTAAGTRKAPARRGNPASARLDRRPPRVFASDFEAKDAFNKALHEFRPPQDPADYDAETDRRAQFLARRRHSQHCTWRATRQQLRQDQQGLKASDLVRLNLADTEGAGWSDLDYGTLSLTNLQAAKARRRLREPTGDRSRVH
jgi:hypothetical protein